MAVYETDWAAYQETLRAWLADLSGLPTYWRDDNVPQFAGDAPGHVLLHISAVEERGLRAWHYAEAGDGSLVPTADRLLRVTLDVSVRAGWNVPGTLAQQRLSRAATKAQLPRDDDAPALASAGTISTVEFDQDGWLVSQATAEWVLYLRDAYQDTDVTIDPIETVEHDVEAS